MIGTTLGGDIERFASRMDEESPLYVAAAQGRFSPAAARRYLVSVRHLIRHTVPHLRRARDVAAARGLDALAAHFAAKVTEEEGHERWADADLHRVGSAERADVSPTMVELLAYLEATIDRDPRLYLTYILFAEYLIALRGSDWLQTLEERCGIPATAMTVVRNHAELDREHASEGVEAIDALVADPALLQPMRDVLRTVFGYFHRFSADVLEDGVATCSPSSIS